MNEVFKSLLMQKPIAKCWEKASLSQSRPLAWPLVLTLRVPVCICSLTLASPWFARHRGRHRPTPSWTTLHPLGGPVGWAGSGEQAAVAKEVSQAASAPLSPGRGLEGRKSGSGPEQREGGDSDCKLGSKSERVSLNVRNVALPLGWAGSFLTRVKHTLARREQTWG